MKQRELDASDLYMTFLFLCNVACSQVLGSRAWTCLLGAGSLFCLPQHGKLQPKGREIKGNCRVIRFLSFTWNGEIFSVDHNNFYCNSRSTNINICIYLKNTVKKLKDKLKWNLLLINKLPQNLVVYYNKHCYLWVSAGLNKVLGALSLTGLQ